MICVENDGLQVRLARACWPPASAAANSCNRPPPVVQLQARAPKGDSGPGDGLPGVHAPVVPPRPQVGCGVGDAATRLLHFSPVPAGFTGDLPPVWSAAALQGHLNYLQPAAALPSLPAAVRQWVHRMHLRHHGDWACSRAALGSQQQTATGHCWRRGQQQLLAAAAATATH
jgi:hypothetical protein